MSTPPMWRTDGDSFWRSIRSSLTKKRPNRFSTRARTLWTVPATGEDEEVSLLGDLAETGGPDLR
ncbi:hypothetical protein ABZ714_14735 [Streptomyces sp. NPDC006798]|uniref:hypothetical protein n=1 Tax=Streptomyces sp. NPDC006798 TaxID=3155462 RepID=UPI0033CB8C91